jgi:beta-glucosidase
VLAAFASLTAEAGATAIARLTVPSRLFKHFDESTRAWVADLGTYTLRAGRSSLDLRLNATVVVR